MGVTYGVLSKLHQNLKIKNVYNYVFSKLLGEAEKYGCITNNISLIVFTVAFKANKPLLMTNIFPS